MFKGADVKGDGVTSSQRVLALCGGVGGAKLALGLSHVIDDEKLTIVVNTGDDFDHLGLRICPDIDTVTYTLAGIVNPETGWGRAGETGSFMDALSMLGGEDWFYLGDKDLALHVERTRRLAEGESLSGITAGIAQQLDIGPRILPMSDDPVATMVETTSGTLAFQHYFVRERCQPPVTGFYFDGIEAAKPHSDLLGILADSCLDAVIVCPSNPFVSIDPILSLPGVRQALRDCSAPVIAVSPIVGGKAVKGPTVKMMAELDLAPTSVEVLKRYQDILNGFVLDKRDINDLEQLKTMVDYVEITDTLMLSLDHKIALARAVVDFARRC
ncbi:MAG: 2-phospho-L-lactate transferase [Gammaproteobacteria bacterium]|nr:MAG: 2-phospho-L-lactate transferase [Gammaproteobacteria bacterium]